MDKSGDETIAGLPSKDAYGSTDPNLPPAVEGIKLNARDLELLQECQIESVQQRCLPFAFLFGLGTHLAIKAGRLAPHPRFGSMFKVATASLTGIIFGKLAYVPVCREKFKADPQSELGRKFREKEGGFAYEPAAASVPGNPTAPPSDVPAQPPAPSYDDLRRRNRLGVDPPMTGRTPPLPSTPVPAEDSTNDFLPVSEPEYKYGQPDPSVDQPSLMRRPRKRVNAYGDEMEDV